MRNRDVRKSGRAGWPLFVAAIGTFLWLGATAAPARADSNFERGFEDQMGRILAYEAVNLGKAVLFQGVVHPAVHHGPSHSGHGYGPGYTANPTVVYDYRRAPVHTHDYGKRPVRWNGYRNKHPGKRLGHYKQYDRRHRKDRHDYDRHDRHHRHDRHCRH